MFKLLFERVQICPSEADMIITAYAVYLATSTAMTIWVASVLYKNGRAFLVDAFHGNETLTDSVNHLLVVGFYLINLGYVARNLEFHERPANIERAVELISIKFGWVLLVLGTMHFFNIFVFSWMRRNGLLTRVLHPVVGNQGIPTL
jgi:hypothetical protein